MKFMSEYTDAAVCREIRPNACTGPERIVERFNLCNGRMNISNVIQVIGSANLAHSKWTSIPKQLRPMKWI